MKPIPHSATFLPDGTHASSRLALDRRRLLRLAAGLGATASAAGIGLGTPWQAAARSQGAAASPAGHTWLLDATDAMRPDDPGEPAPTEVDELLAFQADRTEAMLETITMWGGRRAVLPWLELGIALSDEYSTAALMDFRAQAILHTAMHDAVVAALDAQEAHARPAPAVADERIEPVGDAASTGSSFPSVHAAVAGAAATLLAYLFPDGSGDGYATEMNEAATSRLWAGASYRSDIEAGLALGQGIGDLAVARGKADHSDSEWDGSGWPTGDGFYVPTPPDLADPVLPLGGTWTTWVLPSGDAIRPAPFPAYGSPGWKAELSAVQRATEGRTLAQERIIDYWLSQGGNGYYMAYAVDMIERENLGEAEAASVLAAMNVAIYDAIVAVWDAKYHYWIARPISMDPKLDVYIPAPPYPSYPGGFGSAAGAGATVLAGFFPANEVELLTSAAEAAAQRGWSGIHYVLDDDTALLMGSQVGRMTVDAVLGTSDSNG